MDFTVTTSGENHTRLKLKWILVGRVLAHKLSQGETLATLRRLGFTRFTITDGYDDTWYWDL